jgi:hypothetical protein
MRKLMRAFIAFTLAGTAIPAGATQVGPGVVTSLYIQNGIVLFSVSGSVTGSWPACAVTQRFATEVASPAGQAYLSAVLSAKMAGKAITVHGNGECTYWADSEGISYIEFAP